MSNLTEISDSMMTDRESCLHCQPPADILTAVNGECDSISSGIYWTVPRVYPFSGICMDAPPANEYAVMDTTGRNPYECFNNCLTLAGANGIAMQIKDFHPQPGQDLASMRWDSEVLCTCYRQPNDNPLPAGTDCTPTSYMWYQGDLQVVGPSALSNRRRRLQGVAQQPYRQIHHPLTESEKHHVSLCPRPRLACVVPGTDGYECIDAAEDLESCGGCVHGEHGVSATAVGAANATTLGRE